MNKLRFAALVGALFAFCYTGKANIIEVRPFGGDANFNDVAGGLNTPIVILGWLEGEILSLHNNQGIDLPAPTPGLTVWDNLNGNPPTINVEAGDYLVIQYDAGTAGVPDSKGGLVALFFDAAQSYTPPATGSGPNGFGPISFVDLWDHTNGVPEGGMTLVLLGATCVGLGMLTRFQKTSHARVVGQ